jgi:hypothetical protein
MNILGGFTFNKQAQPRAQPLTQQRAQPQQYEKRIPNYPKIVAQLHSLRASNRLTFSFFNKTIDALPALYVRQYFMSVIANKSNKNLNNYLNTRRLTMYKISKMNITFIRQLLKSTDFFNAYISNETSTGDNLAIGYGNWSQHAWSTVGESRLILCKTSHPKLNAVDAYYGSSDYGQDVVDGEQTYSSYLDIDCSQRTTIKFDMDLRYSRPGIVTSVYLVPMGMHWDPTDYTSYTNYVDISLNTVTDSWYKDLENSEKLELIKKLAPEYGCGYNDAQGAGQGNAPQINLIQATPTGLQVSLNGVFVKRDTDNVYYVTDASSGHYFITDNDEKFPFSEVDNVKPDYGLYYDTAGSYCNIHGTGGGSNSDHKYTITLNDVSIANNSTTTAEQLKSYGPGTEFKINSLLPFQVECTIDYTPDTFLIKLTVTISQVLSGNTNIVIITVESGGFSQQLGLNTMNLVTSYWANDCTVSQLTTNTYKQATWWLDGLNTDAPPTGTTQPIRGITSIPAINTNSSLTTSIQTINSVVTLDASGSTYRNYNKYAAPVSYYKSNPDATDGTKSSYTNNNVSNYVPSICLLKNVNINSSIVYNNTELCGWKMDIMYTGLKDSVDSNGNPNPVNTYWAGRHNGSFQMSYSTTPTYDISSRNANYICTIDDPSNNQCAANCAEYAITRCTVVADPWVPSYADSPSYSEDLPSSNYQYDFATDVLTMDKIRQKECINTDDENTTGSNNYEYQANRGLNIFEAVGITINGTQFQK